MSEHSSSVKDFEESKFFITYDEMIKYMDSKFTSTVCPHCGKDEGWFADTGNAEDHSDAAERMTLYKQPYAHSRLFRLYVVMSCAHCGTLRSISAQRVRDWVNEQSESSNG